MTYGNLAEEIQIEALKNIIERFIYQYQQNEQSSLILTELTKHKKAHDI
jgi:hypothetical protein